MAIMKERGERRGGGDDSAMGGGRRRGGFGRKKVCRFCAETTIAIEYKNPQLLRGFITDRGKMMPRRISGTCARHQRALSLAIRRSRMLALIPFTVTGE